ncbi:hypothetical protein [Pseudarthrobacter sp. 1C304]|uniref:hypothetical protein n=1 Tax=Pseudarthrobacter sp. 1C304 TaxID=3457438 RepID=UPI003FD23881
MTALEWTTLLVCGTALVLRVPDAVRGRNRTVFGILLLATVCSVLAVTAVYTVIDGALGGRHVTSLILRFLVFATVLLVGLRLARGLGDARAYALIAGAPGRWALALCSVAVLAAFLLMDTTGAPAGLQVPSTDSNATVAPYFTAAGRTYPAYISLVLVPPLLSAVRGRQPRLVRGGALLVLLGALFAILTFPVSLVPAGGLHFVNYAAVLGYVGGLVLFWFSGLIAAPSGNAKATLRRNRG